MGYRPRVGVAALLLFAASACRSTSSDGPGTAGPLFDTQWSLIGVSDHGKSIPLSNPRTDVIPFQIARHVDCDDLGLDCGEGPHMFASDTCNSFNRPVTVEQGTISARGVGESTAVFCPGDLVQAIDRFFRSDEIGWQIDGSTLHLTADGLELTYSDADRARD